MAAYAYRRYGSLGHERLQIKRFSDSCAMHRWLNSRYDNEWTEYTGPLKPGTYAYVGGRWQNVKGLPVELLDHV